MSDRTHWEGCHTRHLECALARLAEAESHRDMWQRMLRQMQDLAIARAARMAEAERERDEWHARAIALFWKGDADGATCGHIRAATATIKQLLAADSAPAVLDPERVEIARCPRCGALPRITIMGRTICPNGHGDVDQPMPKSEAHTSWKEREVSRMVRDHQKIIDTKRKSCPRCYGTGAVDAPTSADDPSCPDCDGEGVGQ